MSHITAAHRILIEMPLQQRDLTGRLFGRPVLEFNTHQNIISSFQTELYFESLCNAEKHGHFLYLHAEKSCAVA